MGGSVGKVTDLHPVNLGSTPTDTNISHRWQVYWSLAAGVSVEVEDGCVVCDTSISHRWQVYRLRWKVGV